MNTQEHKKLLEKATCTINLIEQARDVKHNLYVWLRDHGYKFPGLVSKTEKRISLFEDKVIPRLEMRYRNQIHQATQAQ